MSTHEKSFKQPSLLNNSYIKCIKVSQIHFHALEILVVSVQHADVGVLHDLWLGCPNPIDVACELLPWEFASLKDSEAVNYLGGPHDFHSELVVSIVQECIQTHVRVYVSLDNQGRSVFFLEKEVINKIKLFPDEL